MRRWGQIFGLASVAAALVAALWLYSQLFLDQRPLGPPQVFRVAPGQSLTQVAERLHEQGILGAAWKLRLANRLRGNGLPIRAGEYDIQPGSSPASILNLLESGRQRLRRVTLVEGWRSERSAQVLADSLGLDPKSIQSLVEDPPLPLRDIVRLTAGTSLEGYLFPDTYQFASGIQAPSVLRTVLNSFMTQVDSTMWGRMEAMDWSLHAVVTLASIVEAEAVFDDERPRVAAVYLNRLRKGWKLEADPTVAYALHKEGQRLVYRDLEVDSAYNTYRHEGLPPGPINSPGLASLRAVMWPEPDFEAMYFVADGTGRHRFSRTWEEHRRAVEEYRRTQRAPR